MEIPLLRDVITIFGLSIAVLLVCVRLRIPTSVGLLFTGVISGPYGLRLIGAVHEVEILAEIGIALLLFSIGLELSLSRFLKTIRQVLIGGSIQVWLTVACGFGFGMYIGSSWQESLLLGFLLALSSTAIVLKLMQENYAIGTPHGEFTLSTLIYQDLIVVPMMLVIPVLGGTKLDLSREFFLIAGDTIGILVIVIITGTWLVPRLLYLVAQANSSRLFLLSVLFICFFISWLTAQIGLSLALGAFLSGLIISESEYNHHALGNIHPFQEVFTLFFFVSMGMLLDLRFVAEHPMLIVAALVAIILLKGFTATIPAILLGYPLRRAIMAGLALAQVGEFSFLLLKEGIRAGIGDEFRYQLFMATAVFSMALTPFWVWASEPIANFILKLPLPDRLRFGKGKEFRETKQPKRGHVVIIGFGAAGQQLRKKLQDAKIRYTIIDTDPEMVRNEAADGEPIVYGDGTHMAVLEHVHAHGASVVAILVRDLNITKRAIVATRKLSPHLPIIARTRSLEDVASLKKLGATRVVADDRIMASKIFSILKN